MAADQVHHPAPSAAGHYDPADHVHRRHFQGGLRAVLSASQGFRPSVSGDKRTGHLHFPGVKDQRRDRDELRGGVVPVYSRICTDHDRQQDRVQSGQRKRVILRKEIGENVITEFKRACL